MLARSGIRALIDGIRLWHPDIGVGGASCFLREDFYENRVCLDGAHAHRAELTRIDEMASHSADWPKRVK
jgi:hypothetical protein